MRVSAINLWHNANMCATPEPLKPPTGEELYRKALRHLERFSATEVGLTRVLERVVLRWAQKTGSLGVPRWEIDEISLGLRSEIRRIVAEMCRVSAVDDAEFARSRVRNLERTGHSRRAIEAHLLRKGVAPETVSDVVAALRRAGPGDDGNAREFGAALVFARKRRLGPFACGSTQEATGQDKTRALALFARSGFTRDVAERVFSIDREAAEVRLMALKSS